MVATLSGIIRDRLPRENYSEFHVRDPSSGRPLASVTLFLLKKTPPTVWSWVTDFLSRIVGKEWIYWQDLCVIQTYFSLNNDGILEEVGELVKKCCSVENGFTFQVLSWGIFYHNGHSVHLLGLKESDVPAIIEARWNAKRIGITICGPNLNGAQITKTINGSSSILRNIRPLSKGFRKLDKLHIPIPIEELKDVENSFYQAAKVVEFDRISLVVRRILQQKIRPLVMEMKKSFLELIKTKQRLLVEHWKGVLQMEMIECRNKVIIQLQNFPTSEISTFTPMCMSSMDREYWQRALHDLNEDHLPTGSSSQSTTIYSIGGCIKFLLGDFDGALLDFDHALLDSGCSLNSNTNGLASTLLDRAMVKYLLAKYPEAMQDIHMAAKINPNSSDLKRFQACLEDILRMNSSNSSTLLLQPMQTVNDLLTGDHYPNLDYLALLERCPQ